jgi:hypothetical protein
MSVEAADEFVVTSLELLMHFREGNKEVTS